MNLWNEANASIRTLQVQSIDNALEVYDLHNTTLRVPRMAGVHSLEVHDLHKELSYTRSTLIEASYIEADKCCIQVKTASLWS